MPTEFNFDLFKTFSTCPQSQFDTSGMGDCSTPQHSNVITSAPYVQLTPQSSTAPLSQPTINNATWPPTLPTPQSIAGPFQPSAPFHASMPQAHLTPQSSTAPSPLSQLNVDHAALPPALPTPQSTAAPLPLSVPLADITSAIQTPLAIPPTQPGIVNQAQTHPADNSGNSSTSLGRMKRKAVPSLCAQRDNAIGKENRIPPPASAEQEHAKNKGKISGAKSVKRGASKRLADDCPMTTASPKSKKRKVA
ncbi:hypothetical protein L210DRAFT_988861 [Boletus edulis BED1]|uniref:Uncharacterized protein n=1 Tax=Boletus edulis BED1 TaxID=1328754 RepID=A0AAD4C744_BOLED|nr:hypothetical protein L210DRAFT_988861 [Boletus edulis BED1]